MRTLLFRAAPAALALVLLSACEPTTINAGENDPTANEIAAAPPIELPPAMLGSKTYRCKDNTVVRVDYFNDNKTANLRVGEDGAPTPLTAPEAGQPYAGEGYEVTGDATAKSITLKGPKGTQSCNA